MTETGGQSDNSEGRLVAVVPPACGGEHQGSMSAKAKGSFCPGPSFLSVSGHSSTHPACHTGWYLGFGEPQDITAHVVSLCFLDSAQEGNCLQGLQRAHGIFGKKARRQGALCLPEMCWDRP